MVRTRTLPRLAVVEGVREVEGVALGVEDRERVLVRDTEGEGGCVRVGGREGRLWGVASVEKLEEEV